MHEKTKTYVERVYQEPTKECSENLNFKMNLSGIFKAKNGPVSDFGILTGGILAILT